MLNINSSIALLSKDYDKLMNLAKVMLNKEELDALASKNKHKLHITK